jgi:hypothetical protein
MKGSRICNMISLNIQTPLPNEGGIQSNLS